MGDKKEISDLELKFDNINIKNTEYPNNNINKTSDESYFEYTVKKGDTLWGIAQKHLGNGTKYKEIKSLNELESDTIYTGQTLKIPR